MIKNNDVKPVSPFHNALGIISLSIPVIVMLLIFNWLFQITEYQNLQGLPVLMPLFTSPIGIALGAWAMLKGGSKIGKVGFICNIVMCTIPGVYHFAGTIIFGP